MIPVAAAVALGSTILEFLKQMDDKDWENLAKTFESIKSNAVKVFDFVEKELAPKLGFYSTFIPSQITLMRAEENREKWSGAGTE